MVLLLAVFGLAVVAIGVAALILNLRADRLARRIERLEQGVRITGRNP